MHGGAQARCTAFNCAPLRLLIKGLLGSAARDHVSTMHAPPPRSLALLPGTCLVLLLVRVDDITSVVTVASGALVEGLRAANALLSFTGLHREELPLEDLLPWAGSV